MSPWEGPSQYEIGSCPEGQCRDWRQVAWVHIPALPLAGCVTLDQDTDLSEPPLGRLKYK